MNEGRCLGVKAVQTIGLLVDESVVLGNELPADFRRIDGGLVGHDGAVVRDTINNRDACSFMRIHVP